MLKRILCSIVLALFPLFALAEAETIAVTRDSPEFKITQPSNATTGYRWRVIYDKSLMTLKTEKYLVPNSKLIGAGGKTIWVFHAKPKAFRKPPLQTQIHMIYERAWSPKDHPTELFFMVKFV